jgi:hypothetical protein
LWFFVKTFCYSFAGFIKNKLFGIENRFRKIVLAFIFHGWLKKIMDVLMKFKKPNFVAMVAR